MSTQIRRATTNLKELLKDGPQRFDFFQIVRILEWLHREQSEATIKPSARVGGDVIPEKEIVRFQVIQTNNFPGSAIDKIEIIENEKKQIISPVYLDVTFMGLTGPSGVLPDHYTELLKERIHKYKDNALRDFLDIFNHRSISLFHRAWEKYRAPFIWERSQVEFGEEDSFTRSLNSLIGLGTLKLKEQLQIPDQVPLYYSGYFSQGLRSAVALEAMLSDYMKLPVKINQFYGRWLTLDQEERTRLPGASFPSGQYNQLGFDAVLGGRVWDITGSFKIRIESLTYHQFLEFLPTGHDFQRMGRLTRFYAGTSFTFAVQPVMMEKKIPMCKLGRDKKHGFYLGWNVWLKSAEVATNENEIEAPVFFWKD